MQKLSTFGILPATTAALITGLLAPATALAREGSSGSTGHGVKCYWVLVSSVNGTNTYQQVCRKGV